MDVDHIHKYDDYVRGPAREVVTVETKIKPTNKGFAMLAKLGWVEGQPVGLSSDGTFSTWVPLNLFYPLKTIGLTEPIPFHVKADSTGLGKISQDVRMIETTVSQRRGLDSERQQKENEEQRRLREVRHATLIIKLHSLKNIPIRTSSLERTPSTQKYHPLSGPFTAVYAINNSKPWLNMMSTPIRMLIIIKPVSEICRPTSASKRRKTWISRKRRRGNENRRNFARLQPRMV
jgi:hypothetical protein